LNLDGEYNYAVLYEGGGGQLVRHREHWDGQTGKIQLGGPGTITDNLNFSTTSTGQLGVVV
jgi:hypothetical protein